MRVVTTDDDLNLHLFIYLFISKSHHNATYTADHWPSGRWSQWPLMALVSGDIT